MPSWSLHTLLTKQLADAVRGSGDEDPQGEPAEYWWNALNRTGSYCLIDSAWDLGVATEGTLLLRYAQDKSSKEQSAAGTKYVPVIRAFVEAVRSSDGEVLHQWDGPVPPDLAASNLTVEVPWVRMGQTLYPERPLGQQANALRERYPWLKRSKPRKYSEGLQFDLYALVYPSELAFGQTGLGWTLMFRYGHLQAFKPPEKKRSQKPLTLLTLPVYRAGPNDIGWRVPTVTSLKDKRVVVVGTGAVGAPVAVELARNGCRALDLVEHDTVEPGNTIRWPLGASAWGRGKAEALRTFLAQEYPATTVRVHRHFVGSAAQEINEPGDDDVLDPLLAEADLVIDGSASHGITNLLADRCRGAGITLISLFATPTLEGGAVVRHAGDGGCPNCLEHAWHNGDIEPPAGRGAGDDALMQPPGCGERTFVGANYDLQELSLQAVRLTVVTLTTDAKVSSVVQTLSFIDEAGQRSPPRWRVDPLPRHAACGCRP
ncbi:MAG: ThiF family adenylyltransferase [Dehalococcoidia bacterium]